MAPAIEKAIIAFDPNALAKSLKTQVSGLKRGKKFLYPSETPLISEKIDAINSGIQKLLEQNAAESAVDLCQKLIATDEAIFARADDSYGYISCSFYKTYSLLDEAFCAANTP